MTDPLPDGAIVPLVTCVSEDVPLVTELACCLGCGAVIARGEIAEELHRGLHLLYERVIETIGLTDQAPDTGIVAPAPQLPLQAVSVKWEGVTVDEEEVEHERARGWDEGFQAGRDASRGEIRSNPYQYHRSVKP